MSFLSMAPATPQDADDPSVKYHGRSIDIQPGESFGFPFESPEGGCVLRYGFSFADGTELPFVVLQGEKELVSTTSAKVEGELQIPKPGLCHVRWDNTGFLAYYARPLTYDLLCVPSTYLQLLRRRRMLQLASAGELDGVLLALNELPLDAADEKGRTALHAAAAGGHVALVEALLRQGAPLESTTAAGATPLLEACAHAHAQCVGALLAADADPCVRDGSGRTALHVLADCAPFHEGEAAAAMAQLLDHPLAAESLPGVEPLLHAPDAQGATPLVRAASVGLRLLCEQLLGAGAAVDAGALRAVAASGEASCVQLLLRSCTVPLHETDAASGEGGPLHAAAAAGHVPTIGLLLERLREQDALEEGGDDGSVESVARVGRLG